MRSALLTNLLLTALIFFPVTGVATAAEAEHGEEQTSHHESEHKNELGLILGATDEQGHSTQFTWGFDYKRKITERWALGGFFDYAGGELRNAIVAPAVFFRPGLGNLQLVAAPGVEFHQGRDGGGHGDAHGETDEDATYFVFRLGAAYDIHLGGRYGLAPNFNVDFVEGEKVWVYGFVFTYGF